jgi:hypothetical protein
MPELKIGLSDLLDNDHETIWFETIGMRELGTFKEKKTLKVFLGPDQSYSPGTYNFIFSKGEVNFSDATAYILDNKEYLFTKDASNYLRLKELKVKDDLNKMAADLKAAYKNIIAVKKKMAVAINEERVEGKTVKELMDLIYSELDGIHKLLTDPNVGYALMCAKAIGGRGMSLASSAASFFTKRNNKGVKSNNNNTSVNTVNSPYNSETLKIIKKNIIASFGLIEKIHTVIFKGSATKAMLFKSLDTYEKLQRYNLNDENLSTIGQFIKLLSNNIAKFKSNIDTNYLNSCNYAGAATGATAAASAASAAASALGSLWGRSRGGKTMKKNKNGKKNTRRGKKRV